MQEDNSDTKAIQVKAVLAEDINQIARKNLEDRKTRIWTKTIARAILKQAVAKASADAVEKEYGEAAGIFARLSGQLTASATERLTSASGERSRHRYTSRVCLYRKAPTSHLLRSVAEKRQVSTPSASRPAR